MQNLCLEASYLCKLPWVALELTISDLHISGPTWWPFLVPSHKCFFFWLQSYPFPMMLLWLNESAGAFVICCQVFWAAAFLGFSQAVTAASGLSAGCLLCSFFLLINAYILSEWPVLRVTEWLMCFVAFSFGTPPDLPRLELIEVCSLLQSDSPTRYPLHQLLLTA